MILGFDVSSKLLAMVALPDSGYAAMTYEFEIKGSEPHPEYEACRNLSARFSVTRWGDVWLAGVEHTFSRGMGAAGQLKMLTGCLVGLIQPHVVVVPMPPNEWQREFLFDGDRKQRLPAKGKDRKPLIKARSVELGMSPDLCQDVHDAFGIAVAVRAINQRAIDAAP